MTSTNVLNETNDLSVVLNDDSVIYISQYDLDQESFKKVTHDEFKTLFESFDREIEDCSVESRREYFEHNRHIDTQVKDFFKEHDLFFFDSVKRVLHLDSEFDIYII